MRKIALVKNNNDTKKVMIYATKKETYLFLYQNIDDISCYADYWFDGISDVEEMCLEEYNITQNDWQIIDDPLPHCQHDIIEPVRVKGRNIGNPEWGSYEKLENGKWIVFKF